MSQEEADKALKRAQSQLARVQSAIWDPEDREEAITWAFYAYENAIVSAAEKLGSRWTRRHDQKADLAEALFKGGHVPANTHDLLEQLNGLRKDVQYGEPGPDLLDLDLEDLASKLESFIGEVGRLVRGS